MVQLSDIPTHAGKWYNLTLWHSTTFRIPPGLRVTRKLSWLPWMMNPKWRCTFDFLLGEHHVLTAQESRPSHVVNRDGHLIHGASICMEYIWLSIEHIHYTCSSRRYIIYQGASSGFLAGNRDIPSRSGLVQMIAARKHVILMSYYPSSHQNEAKPASL